jgi:hypothetical protein
MNERKAMELLDEINVIKGGVFPFDVLTELAVTQATAHGVRMEATDDFGKTALHYAAERTVLINLSSARPPSTTANDTLCV